MLARQQRMGLAKAAGTEDLYFSVARGGGGRRGGRGGGRGAGEQRQQEGGRGRGLVSGRAGGVVLWGLGKAGRC